MSVYVIYDPTAGYLKQVCGKVNGSTPVACRTASRPVRVDSATIFISDTPDS